MQSQHDVPNGSHSSDITVLKSSDNFAARLEVGGASSKLDNDPLMGSGYSLTTSKTRTTTSTNNSDQNCLEFVVYRDHILDPITNIWPFVVRGGSSRGFARNGE